MRWTDKEKALVVTLNDVGLSYDQIAAAFAKQSYVRNAASVRLWLTDNGIAHKQKVTPKTNDLEIANKLLSEQLEQFAHKTVYNIDKYDAPTARFGLITDTHLGSMFENLPFLNHAYDVFQKEGIRIVYHGGDLDDGEHMYPGHEYEIHIHGCDAQVEYTVNEYPQRDGTDTEYILGNHDLSFWKRSGIDIGKQIASQRPDMKYLGPSEADVTIETTTGKATLRLAHPGKGSAYAISYQIQKYIESLTGGAKPNILTVGHYHKVEYLLYRNVQAFQAGTCQFQTPFMRSRNLAAMMGFWIIELKLDETGIIECGMQFFPCYV